MTIQQPILSFFLIIVSTAISLYAWKRWQLRHIRPVSATGSRLLWCGSVWLLCNALEMAGPDLDTAAFWNRVQYIAIVPIPLLWFYLSLQLTHMQHLLTGRRLVLISIVPLIYLTMALTNDAHHLFMSNVRGESLNSFFNVDYDAGPFMFLCYFYGYIFIMAGTYILTRNLLSSRWFRWQGTIVLLGVTLTVFANVLDWSRLNPFPQVKLTPISLSISIPLFIATLAHTRRADILPIARSSIIQTMPDAVMVLDIENRIIDMNLAAENLIGRRLAAVLGKAIEEAWPAAAENIAVSSAERNCQYEVRLDEPYQQRIFDVRQSRLDHGGGQVSGRVIVFRDITDRMQAEEALRTSEERYYLHFSHVNDVIYSFDSQFNLLTVSPSVERHLGIKPDEFVGKSILELGVLAPEYFEKAAVEAARVLAGDRIEGAIYEMIAKDGTRLMAEISASPIIKDGRVIAAVNVARNITERVRADERLRDSLDEKEVLLKEVHHRVKNNMQIIASLLSLQASATDDPSVRVQLDDSQNRIRSMSLVHERLYRSQDLANIDFQEYLHDLTDSLIRGYGRQGTGVELSVAVDDVYLDVELAVPCGLIVNELVSNALKHAFPNDAKGTIKIEGRRCSDSSYCLAVHDDGVGLPPDIGLAEGKTLGLQLIAVLAKQLDAKLAFCTENGTTVSLTFPYVTKRHPVGERDERNVYR